MTTNDLGFNQMAVRATGHRPYPYQARLAVHGLPEVLAVETGAGKTAAVFLAWLWRRRFHPDPTVRGATPHWLVLCEPLRTLTEQAEAAVRTSLANLGLEEDVLVHVVMGGREDARDRWRRRPEGDAVVIGTLDMLLSRALNRGYAASRFSWPIDFGLLHNGCHWVFDEVQLMGPALPTSRQLDGLRRRMGTALPTSSTWMSATLDWPALATVDNPDIAEVVALDDDDRSDPGLATRLNGGKVVQQLAADSKHRSAALAEALVDAHTAGTLTLAVLNTVSAARDLFGAVRQRAPEAEVILLHSRFRPPDRRRAAAAALAPVPSQGPGRIVVSTQVVEAGVDVSAATMLTEGAPWASIVQRAGRCNRDGTAEHARLIWVSASGPSPYQRQDVDAAEAELQALEGVAVTSSTLRSRTVAMTRPAHPVLRRPDLLGLFDTTPDLSGNDIDVAPFLREADDLDVHVAWRDLAGTPPLDELGPAAEELCLAPVGKELRDLLAAGRPAAGKAWRFDHLAGGWVRLGPGDVRPGLVILFDAGVGGYAPESGWNPANRTRVEPHVVDTGISLVNPEEAVGDDPITYATRQWVALRRHLEEVEASVRSLFAGLNPTGLSAAQQEAAALAGRFHDLGKAHPVFQDALVQLAGEDELAEVERGRPWAKSASTGRARYQRRAFRHELASALVLLQGGATALDDNAETDLVVYLVAAHHGRIRIGIRAVPDDGADGYVLGIAEGDDMPAVEIPGGLVPASSLSLGPVRLGRSPQGSPSWSERALALRDRPDLGPFRLAFLEAAVRLADWRASAAPQAGA